MSTAADAPFTAVGAGDTSPARAPAASWWTLAMLMLLGLYTFMDRQVIALQVDPIRQQLGLTDFQIGLVQGIGVALLTAVVGYPIGWLADRYDRRWVLAGSVAIWSVAVTLCGLARNFEELFAASAIVGVGEAGLLPIAYALIPEMFRDRQRQLANSIFIVTGRLAVGLVIALCGWLVHGIGALRPWMPEALQALPDWRLALLATAVPGLLLLPLILTMPTPRHQALARAPGAPKPVTARVWPFLRRQRASFGLFYLGMGLTVFGYSAVGAFVPAVAMRQMGASALTVGNAMGLATFVSAAAGLLFSVYGFKRLGPRFGPRLPIAMLALSAAIGAATALAMLAASTPTQLFTLLGLHLMFVMTGAMLFPTALQDMTPAPLRARLVSIVILVNIVFGSVSPAVVGRVSDVLNQQGNGLMLAMAGTAAVSLMVSSLLLSLCSRFYPQAVADARASEASLAASGAATP